MFPGLRVRRTVQTAFDVYDRGDLDEAGAWFAGALQFYRANCRSNIVAEPSA